MIARMRKNQTGVENRRIKWEQVKETVLDYKSVSPPPPSSGSPPPPPSLSDWPAVDVPPARFYSQHTQRRDI